MITSRDLSILNMIVNEELNSIGLYSQENESYKEKLLSIQKVLKPYKINFIDNKIKQDIVDLIGVKIEIINIELNDFVDGILISMIEDAIKNTGDSEVDIQFLDEEDDDYEDEDEEYYGNIEVSEAEAERIAMYLMKKEYESLRMKFVS